MTYLVAYDLYKPGQQHEEIDTALEDMGACRILNTTWAVNTGLSLEALKKTLAAYLDENDRLFIMQGNSNIAMKGFTKGEKLFLNLLF